MLCFFLLFKEKYAYISKLQAARVPCLLKKEKNGCGNLNLITANLFFQQVSEKGNLKSYFYHPVPDESQQSERVYFLPIGKLVSDIKLVK